MSQSPPTQVPQKGLADSETPINKHQADPACENVEPTSPVGSYMSMKSDHSMNSPIKFQAGSSSTHVFKPDAPVPSCLSMKSNNSMKPPLHFQNETSQVPSLDPNSPVRSCLSMKSGHSMTLLLQEETLSTPGVKPDSPVPSCLSMKSDNSMNPPLQFQNETSQVPRAKPALPLLNCSISPPGNFLSNPSQVPRVKPDSPVPSCLSMKSDNSMNPPLHFQNETSQVPSVEPNSPVGSCLSMKSGHSMNPLLTFQEETLSTPGAKPALPSLNCSKSLPGNFLSNPSQVPRSSTLPGEELCRKLKSIHKTRFQWIADGLQRHGNTTLLNDIYTQLYITEGGIGEVNNEHEVRQAETASMTYQTADEKPINCNDIFKPLQGQDRVIRTVLTNGVAGIGKTVSVQKFILDWAEATANQEVHFIFPLPFRELNLLKDQCFSLEGLLHHFFPELKEITFTDVSKKNILFIFDGLDEHRLRLDFQKSMIISKENISASVSVLLTNLIQGYLLPLALIWITSRPAAASQIPSKFLSQVTEIRGFNDPQKREYIRKSIKDENLANDVIKHLMSTRSLYIMCHIPVFCWISATVLEKMLKEVEGKAIPRTLTQMYTHFLIIQMHIREEKYNEEKTDDREMIFKLGELAFKQLLKGNLIFYEEDLEECGINVRDAVVYSGVCTQIFREEFELLYSKRKVFCFVHLSIQEHLAALYVHIAFSRGNSTVLYQWDPSNYPNKDPCLTLTDLNNSAVDKALQCKSGEFDLFLRFLLGISQERNQALLKVLLPEMTASSSQNIQDTIEYIKIRLRMNLNPEKYINLFHCLNELNDFSLEEEIQEFQRSRRLAKTRLSPSQWSALVFVLLTSENALDVFDLMKYSMENSDECLQRMLPVVKLSRIAELRNCNLSDKGFYALTSALSSKMSNLREVKLSGTSLHQSGMRILSKGLQSPHCKLEVLELYDCVKYKECSSPILSAFKSNPSHLRMLDLGFNPLSVSEITLLFEALRNPHCGLETLKLYGCQLNSDCCSVLAVALKNNSSLIELDLSKNALKSGGAQKLSEGLRNPSCKLTVLKLADCGITNNGCRSLCSALNLNPSHLRELCLNRNTFGDMGMQHISNFISKPYCKLEKLSLSNCSVSGTGCNTLASALELNPSHLKELELSGNQLGTSGREKLGALQQHKDYRLEKLRL